jgi:hypothetical protein
MVGVTNWNDFFQVKNHNLFNLSDLNQSNTDVYQYLLDGSKFWIDAGVDAIRIDAIKHMDKSFIQKWTSDIYDYSKSIGREGFFSSVNGLVPVRILQQVLMVMLSITPTLPGQRCWILDSDTLERVLVGRSGNTMKTLNSYLIKDKQSLPVMTGRLFLWITMIWHALVPLCVQTPLLLVLETMKPVEVRVKLCSETYRPRSGCDNDCTWYSCHLLWY